jgi:putative salt-induced outer membrane protein
MIERGANGQRRKGADFLVHAAGVPLWLAVSSGVFCGVSSALAQTPPAPPPAGLSSQAPASAGSTQAAKEGFQAVALPAADSKDGTTFKLTAGGLLSAGNSRNLALTTAADYFLRRGSSQFSALAAINYGRSAPGPDLPSETTVENYQGNVRYDYFFAGSLAGFGSVSARRDRFQQLDLRLNFDPGLAYYFIDQKEQRLWGELGYDLQYDVRRQEAVDASIADPTLDDLKRTQVRHSVRLFAGYVNQVNSAVKFNASAEYLQNVTQAKNARVNLDLGLTSQINGSFSIASTFSLKFDNNPLPGVEKTDLVTALNLVYTLQQ